MRVKINYGRDGLFVDFPDSWDAGGNRKAGDAGALRPRGGRSPKPLPTPWGPARYPLRPPAAVPHASSSATLPAHCPITRSFRR